MYIIYVYVYVYHICICIRIYGRRDVKWDTAICGTGNLNLRMKKYRNSFSEVRRGLNWNIFSKRLC